MEHGAANPLANEVSRAFVPPCTRRDVSPTGSSSRTSALFSSAGTLATNSITYAYARSVPDFIHLILNQEIATHKTNVQIVCNLILPAQKLIKNADS